MTTLTDRRIVVTGAGAGIGLAVTNRYLAEGASVVAVVRTEKSKAVLTESDRLKVVVGDVTDYETSAAAVRKATECFGGLDVFVANAGKWDFHKRLQKLSPDQLAEGFDQIMAVNLKSAFFGAHAALESLASSKGSFVVTGSNACFRPGGGGSLYTSSKYALRGLVAQLAIELSPDVRVNGVAPGATNTSLSGSQALGQESKALNEDASRVAAMEQHLPLGRISEPEEHTDFYVLLAGTTAPYVTGTILVSDGGISAGQ